MVQCQDQEDLQEDHRQVDGDHQDNLDLTDPHICLHLVCPHQVNFKDDIKKKDSTEQCLQRFCIFKYDKPSVKIQNLYMGCHM